MVLRLDIVTSLGIISMLIRMLLSLGGNIFQTATNGFITMTQLVACYMDSNDCIQMPTMVNIIGIY